MFKHVHEPVPNIMAVRPDLPPICQEVIARSMAKSPDARYAKAVYLAQTLAQAVPQGFAGPAALEQPGPVSDESGAVQTGTPTAALTSEPTVVVEEVGRSRVLERPVSSGERIDRILRGNNRTVGLAVLILLALLCGGMLLVPSIWSALLNLGSF
jgi:hypothetical protein